ncbi:hypothetical protein [Poseidonibacter ostreae]|uniref:Uncharacterized protein n=1 Tax=Poseidonibacter ostreae TaxID=2654171 RepID=A0A6L4WXZ7_9BACT|nr:hypothetical protein [Poseidonibacter ostreae]KAB7891330.1 hypothetical protein GBG19_00405 [Poseidonibacter ostreae]
MAILSCGSYANEQVNSAIDKISNTIKTEAQLNKELNAVQNNNESVGFKDTLMNRVDEKMSKLTAIVEENARLQEENRLNSELSLQTAQQITTEEVALPVLLGSTIISKKKIGSKRTRVLSTEALVVDADGNKYSMNTRNNNIIKRVHSDYIDFNDSDKKIPMIISSNNGELATSTPKINSVKGIVSIDKRFRTIKNDVKASSLKDSVIKELVKK